jgi:hypothetical protein
MANLNDKANELADALDDAKRPRKTGNWLADSVGRQVVTSIASTAADAADLAAKLTGGRKKSEGEEKS